MKVTAYIRRRGAAKNNLTDMATVYFRVCDGRTDIKAASELTINPNHWSQEQQSYKPRVTLVSDKKRRAFDKSVRELAEMICRLQPQYKDTMHNGRDNTDGVGDRREYPRGCNTIKAFSGGFSSET